MASILSTIQLETTSTSGTLTSEQLATLQESKTNYIVYGTELFKLVDNNTSGDTLIYTCSTNDSGTLKVKSITVTISTLAWTYSELSSGGTTTKKYQHNIYLRALDNYEVKRFLTFSFVDDNAAPYLTLDESLTNALFNAGFNKYNSSFTCNGFDELNTIIYQSMYIQDLNSMSMLYNGIKITTDSIVSGSLAITIFNELNDTVVEL